MTRFVGAGHLGATDEGPILGSLDVTASNPFGPQSTIRRVVGEPIVHLLYPRALIMEVAHPSVGAAVAEHSRFQEQPVHRLGATSDAALRLIFGEGDEPMAAARQIYRFHDRINGSAAGGPYTAHDASLLLWVWATLVDACDVAFCRWVRPYRPGEGEAFYEDMCAFARFFGIPATLIPPDRQAFADYFEGMLDGDILGSTATSVRVVRDVLWFRRWFLPPPAMSALRLLAVGTLDRRLADRLGLHLTAPEQCRFDRLDELLRHHYARLPEGRANLPYRYLSLRRVLVRMDRPDRFWDLPSHISTIFAREVTVEDRYVLAEDSSRIEELEVWAGWQESPAPTLEFPTDRVRATATGRTMERVALAVEPDLLETIAHLAEDSGFTLEAALLAAFQTLLARYSGQDQVAVAVPERVVCTDLTGDPTFTELLARVNDAMGDSDDREDRPLDPHRAAGGPPRAGGSVPFFPHLLVYGDDPGKAAVAHELKVFVDAAGLAVEFDRQLFAPETAAGIATHLRVLLEEIAADPNRPLSQLQLFDDRERALLVEGWNDTALDLPAAAIHELVEEQADRHPDAPAVGDRTGWLTYRELNQRANQLAHHLQGLGVGIESLVGISVTRSSAMVVAMLGVLKAGGAYLPLDPEYPADRVAFMLADASVPVLITESALLPRLPKHDAQVVCLDDDAAALAAEADDNLSSGVGPGNLAYAIYTSGSTGRPKGVLVEHRGIVSLVCWARTAYSAHELERVLASTSMCFDLSVFEVFVPLTGGTSVYVADDLLDLDWPKSAPTLINTVPSVLAAVLGDKDLPHSLMTVNLAGEPLGRELVRATLARTSANRVLNLYGPSEATVYCTAAVIGGGADDSERVPIGRPVANTEIYLLDGRRQLVPQGATGEIYIGGAGLARGYLNRPDLTAERFVEHPFRPGSRLYRSGDLGRYRIDGTIDFFGRVDDQVKIRGFRIEPAEIEAALLTHRDVAQAAVVTRDDGPGQRRLVGYLVAQSQPGPAAAELRAHLGRTLPDYMIPAAFVFLDALPRSPSGKLDRHALPAPDTRPPDAVASAEPRSATEVALAQIWADVLSLPKVGVEDDFFELGGHSLLAAEMVTRVEQTFRRKLPVTLVLQAATIRALAAVLESKDSGQVWRSVFPIRPDGARQPLFCLHGLAGDVTGYRHLLPYLGSDQPLYGIQCVGLDGVRAPHTRVQHMAAHYISEIRAIQPDGPYLLAGICFGALVAYEIAYQLTTRHGVEVALVALVDPTPLPTRTISEQMRRRVAKFRRVARGERATFLAETAGIVTGVVQVTAWGVVVERRIRKRRPVPRSVLAMEAVNIKATLAYTPPSYGGPIVLYRSEGLATQDDEARALAWESLSGPNIEVVDVAGASHESLFTEPYIRIVAEHLRDSIDRALLGVPSR